MQSFSLYLGHCTLTVYSKYIKHTIDPTDCLQNPRAMHTQTFRIVEENCGVCIYIYVAWCVSGI